MAPIDFRLLKAALALAMLGLCALLVGERDQLPLIVLPKAPAAAEYLVWFFGEIPLASTFYFKLCCCKMLPLSSSSLSWEAVSERPLSLFSSLSSSFYSLDRGEEDA